MFHPLLAQWIVRGEDVVDNFLAQCNSEALPFRKEGAFRSKEDIRVEVPKIVAIPRLVCQESQHEIGLVIREMKLRIKLQEHESHLVRDPILVRIVAGALELV